MTVRAAHITCYCFTDKMYSNTKCKIIFIFIECAEQISTIAFKSLIGYDWGKKSSAMSTFILDDYLLYLSIQRREKNSYEIDNGSQLFY